MCEKKKSFYDRRAGYFDDFLLIEDANTVNYTYDALGRQTSARPATVSDSGYASESGSEQATFTYSGNLLSGITTGSTTYGFTYDVYQNRKSVKVGSGNIAYYIYAAGNGKLIYTVYANGYVTKNVYDALDRLSEVWYTQISGALPTTDSAYDGYTYTRKEAYTYDEAGRVSALIDYVTGEKTVYAYDTEGRPIQAMRFDSTGGAVAVAFAENATYNQSGLVSRSVQRYIYNDNVYTNTRNYVYDAYQRLVTYYYGATTSSNRCHYTYDDFSRVTEKALTYSSLSIKQAYSYLSAEKEYGESSTSRVAGYTSTVGSTSTAYSYTYDARGNITQIYIGGVLKYSYVYDNLSQLVRENNAVSNKSYVYTYDDAGNILTKETYAFTKGPLGNVQSTYSYAYGNTAWGDQLTSYRGTAITYDAIGNPLSYYNGSSYTFTWSQGRRLATAVKGGVTTVYTYNADGIRTGKTVGSTVTEYVLNGSQIVAEKRGDIFLRYLYDAQGLPVGMILDGTTYLYEKNLQGDVVGIYTTSGTKVATYVYDAWGKIVSSSYTSGYYNPYYYNPFRYRGYYYDTETGFYYLQSRYYDPTTCRFINADIYLSTGIGFAGYNMYAYCNNNPVMYVDYTGEGPVLFVLFMIGVSVGIGVVVGLDVPTEVSSYLDSVVKQNESNNIALDNNPQTSTKNQLIRSQHGYYTHGFKYGLYNASYNACEVIAIHNAKILMGMDSSLSQAMIDCRNAGAMVGYGVFGSKPRAIETVLKQYGFTVSSISGFDEIRQDGVYIVSYMEGLKIHTVTVQVVDGVYSSYNAGADIRDIMNTKPFLRGYYVE